MKREVRCLNIFSEQVLTKKYGFKDYKLVWSSGDDRVIIDFSSGKPIFSTDAIVYM
jgi:hypothetical protein